MRTSIGLIGLIGLMGVMALAAGGCGQRASKTEMRVAEMEGQVRQMEAKMAQLETKLFEGLDITTNTLKMVTLIVEDSRRFNAEMTGLAEKQQENWSNLKRVLGELQAAITNRPAPIQGRIYATPQRPAAAAPRRSAAPVTVSGVPADVYAGIRAAAVRKWEGKYDMQVYEIELQVEAYRKLHP